MRHAGSQLTRLDVNVVTNDHEDTEAEDVVGMENVRGGLSAKAGIILGIHNIFIVVPQFLATGLSSIIFAIFDPDKPVLHGHPGGAIPSVNATLPTAGTVTINGTVGLTGVEEQKNGPNSVAIIFRLGGVSAAIAFVLCWRLARELRHR
jgi:solute carrier family 45 protein 1/2/4